MKKILGTSAIAIMFAAACLFGGAADANAGNKPTISKIKDKKDDSLTLDVLYAKWAKKNVDIRVKIKNKDKDTEETRTFSKKLSSKGKIELKIDELNSDTKYSFKVQIKKENGSEDYGDYSDSISKTTEN